MTSGKDKIIAREYQRLIVAESRAKQKLYDHEYWLKNKDKRGLQQKKWRDANLESTREKKKKYREENKATIQRVGKEYRAANLEKIKSKDKAYRQSPKGRLQMYRSAAKSRSLDFSLATDDFNSLLSLPCHYCGEQAGGIDRKDNKIGYFSYNVVACCWSCNFMKGTQSYREFSEKIHRIANHLSIHARLVPATTMVET